MREELDGEELSATGDVQVDEALKPLERLDDLPVHEHAAVVEEVHRTLQGRLTGDEQASTNDEEG